MWHQVRVTLMWDPVACTHTDMQQDRQAGNKRIQHNQVQPLRQKKTSERKGSKEGGWEGGEGRKQGGAPPETVPQTSPRRDGKWRAGPHWLGGVCAREHLPEGGSGSAAGCPLSRLAPVTWRHKHTQHMVPWLIPVALWHKQTVQWFIPVAWWHKRAAHGAMIDTSY